MPTLKRMSRILAHNIKLARQELRLTQAEVAKRAGLSVRQFLKIENGSTNPSIETLCRLSTTFGITADQLMRVGRIRTDLSSDDYLTEFKSTFDRDSTGAGIRTLKGVVLYGNRATERLGLASHDQGRPLELLKVLRGPQREIRKNQLRCEERGLAIPYTNFTTSRTSGESTFIRYYPVLVLPSAGPIPYFAALYVTTPDEDTHLKYYGFFDRLLAIS